MTNEVIELGAYDGVSISARDDGYVNATQMCKACGKLWGHYWQNQQTQEFVEALALDIGIPISKLTMIVRGRGDSIDQGTWIHRKLAIHLANWLSPQFAVWCINRLDDLFQRGVTSINREHAEHSLVIAAVDRMAERVLAPMAESIVGIRNDVGEIKKTVVVMDNRLTRVEDVVSRNRRELKDSVKQRHREFITHEFDGKCPCCLRTHILIGGSCIDAQYDHWYVRQNAGIDQTWLICRPCHSRLTSDTEFKESSGTQFNNYQFRRERFEQPLL